MPACEKALPWAPVEAKQSRRGIAFSAVPSRTSTVLGSRSTHGMGGDLVAAHTTTEWNCGRPRGYPVSLFLAPPVPLPQPLQTSGRRLQESSWGLLGAYERGVGLENLAGAEAPAARRSGS